MNRTGSEPEVSARLRDGEGSERIEVTIDGRPHALAVGEDEAALELLRERLGITAPKLVCGTGVCGACAIQVDGVPLNACVLPAAALAGREVRTAAGDRHPVHRAFAALDGMQCGFCTPGFVVEAIAFVDSWRERNGTGRPSEEEISAALAGHLCRCGAYPNVTAAVAAACAGEYDADDDVPPPRAEATEKASGTATYTLDVRRSGQVDGLIVRSPYAHARVGRIGLERAAAIAGVHAVHALVEPGDRVRYVGQEVAAIAAEAGVLRRAAAAIEIAYEPLPAAIGVERALAAGAPAIWRGRRRKAPRSAEWPIPPARWRGNLRGPTSLLSNRGRRARRAVAAASAGQRVEGRWSVAAQMHSALEPHVCVAEWEDGGLNLWISTQGVNLVARQVAKRFGLPRSRVRVRAEHVGGAFGAKGDLQVETVAAIELSRKAGRPVRVVLDRAAELTVGGIRPGATIDLALAGDERGLAGMTVDARSDGGVSVGSPIAAMLRQSYPGAKYLADYDIVTNQAPGKPFRAPGGPPGCWALEQAVDQLASQLGVGPLELRRRWDDHHGRSRLYDWVDGLAVWRERQPDGSQGGRLRHGVGMAAGSWAYLVDPGTEVEVAVAAGRVVARCATQDVGTGARTVVRQAVAEALGAPLSQVEVEIGDSDHPHGPLAAASRTTASVVPAAAAAARELRAALLGDGPAPEHWDSLLEGREGMRAKAGRPRDGKRYQSPITIVEVRPGYGTSGAVHVVSVEVDVRLGRVRPTGVWAGLAVGRVNAPVLAANQAHGGVVQGLGYALYEERDVEPNLGSLRNASLESYKIPGISDIPPIEVHWDSGEGYEHALGGIGLGELTTLPVAAAVGNAVANAVGWRPRDLPMRPDRVLAGLAGHGRGEG